MISVMGVRNGDVFAIESVHEGSHYHGAKGHGEVVHLLEVPVHVVCLLQVVVELKLSVHPLFLQEGL